MQTKPVTPDPVVSGAAVASTESAGFGRRLGAVAIDAALSAGVAALFVRPPGLVSAVVFFIAYTFFTGFFGQTPGMRLLGMRCLRFSNQSELGLVHAALRTVLLQLVVPAVFLDRSGRGLHDRWTDSVVVHGR